MVIISSVRLRREDYLLIRMLVEAIEAFKIKKKHPKSEY